MILLQSSGFINFIPPGLIPWLLTLTGTSLTGLSVWVIKQYISAGSKQWGSFCGSAGGPNIIAQILNNNHFERIEKDPHKSGSIVEDMGQDQRWLVEYC